MAMVATLDYKADSRFSLVAPPKLVGVFKPKEFCSLLWGLPTDDYIIHSIGRL